MILNHWNSLNFPSRKRPPISHNIWDIFVTVISVPRGRLPASVNFCNNEKEFSTDYPYWQITRTQKQRKPSTHSSFIVFVGMISLSVQLINFHIFCFWCFIENDTTCKKSVLKRNRYPEINWFIVFVDMIFLSVQLINFHIFCFRCFIENDTTFKNQFSKEIDTPRSTESEESLEMGKYSLTQSSAS